MNNYYDPEKQAEHDDAHMVEFTGCIIEERVLSYHVGVEGQRVWIPKSIMVVIDEDERPAWQKGLVRRKITFSIPVWLALEKGII